MSALTVARKLLAPLNYLRIKHEEKRWYDFYVPIVMALGATGLVAVLPNHLPIVSDGGLVDQVRGLLQILVGFYIAALAAVSTFASEGMDELMKGEPPRVDERRRGEKITVPLTRRRFLCYLFGYLALMAFFLFVVGLIAKLLAPALLGSCLPGWAVKSVYFCFVGAYFLALANMATTTMLGLYYLTIKIHE